MRTNHQLLQHEHILAFIERVHFSFIGPHCMPRLPAASASPVSCLLACVCVHVFALFVYTFPLRNVASRFSQQNFLGYINTGDNRLRKQNLRGSKIYTRHFIVSSSYIYMYSYGMVVDGYTPLETHKHRRTLAHSTIPIIVCDVYMPCYYEDNHNWIACCCFMFRVLVHVYG